MLSVKIQGVPSRPLKIWAFFAWSTQKNIQRTNYISTIHSSKKKDVIYGARKKKKKIIENMNILIYLFLPIKIHKISTANIEVYEAIRWNWYREAQLLQKVTYLRLFIMHVLLWTKFYCNIHLLIVTYACHDMRYIWMVEINIFLSKQVQILMFMFSIF